jgi:hypothetical protein
MRGLDPGNMLKTKQKSNSNEMLNFNEKITFNHFCTNYVHITLLFILLAALFPPYRIQAAIECGSNADLNPVQDPKYCLKHTFKRKC